MKLLTFILLPLLLTTTHDGGKLQNANLVNLQFATQEEAADLLKTEDRSTDNWNQFDLLARLQQENGSKADLLQFTADQARNWTEDEMHSLSEKADYLNAIIKAKQLHLPFPEKIRLLKTTMKEYQGVGGYTRKDYIVLIERIMNASDEVATALLAHETFHILTRNQPEFRKQMYQLIGFHILPNEITFPKELKDKLIANPDVERHDSYATFLINGEEKDCTMIIYAKSPYKGGSFLEYINIGLVEIDKSSCKAIEKDGEAVIYSIDDTSDFFGKVGRNTNYLFDPEEILAENFSFLLTDKQDVQTPALIEAMEEVLKK